MEGLLDQAIASFLLCVLEMDGNHLVLSHELRQQVSQLRLPVDAGFLDICGIVANTELVGDFSSRKADPLLRILELD